MYPDTFHFFKAIRILPAAMLWFSVMTGMAGARPDGTFAENPEKRSEQALEAQLRAQQNKAVVRAWAHARGMVMRHDDGKRVTEIMALQDGRPLFHAGLGLLRQRR